MIACSVYGREAEVWRIILWTFGPFLPILNGMRGAFTRGLNEQIRDELASRDKPADLSSLVSLAIRIDGRLRQRRQRAGRSQQPPASRALTSPFTTAATPATSSPVAAPEEEPMQLGRARLTPAERQRRMAAGLCVYCGKAGHFLASCPLQPKA